MRHTPIEQLIIKCREQDRAAQKELFNRYADQMQRICYRYLSNSMDAEEMVLNGFLKVFQNLNRFDYRGEASLVAWIKRIMVNESLMLLRKNNNFKMVSETALATKESSMSADDQLEAEPLYKLINELPTGYRTVFNLYAIEGFTHKEIAYQLGISENTSKSQLSKARSYLQKRIPKP